jgi:hypothetical protein
MTNPPKVTIAGFEVIATGTVVSFGWQSIDVYPVDQIYHVRISFESKANEASAAYINQPGPGQTIIRLINFDAPGRATAAPLYVANWKGRKMFLSILCQMMGEGATGTRVTAYTFYSGETV